MTTQPRTPHVPLPDGVGWCTACLANVPINARGRCSCGLLAVWPEGRPRPEIVTAHLLKLNEAVRLDPTSKQGMHHQPRNVRQLRGGRR